MPYNCDAVGQWLGYMLTTFISARETLFGMAFDVSWPTLAR